MLRQGVPKSREQHRTLDFRDLRIEILGSSLFLLRWGLDGWRIMPIYCTGTDFLTVAGAWEELAGGRGAVCVGVFDLPVEG